MATKIPDSMKAKKFDDYWSSRGVAIDRLPPGSKAKAIAQGANQYADTTLWTKGELERVLEKLRPFGVDPAEPDQIIFRRQGALTEAGEIFRDLVEATLTREDIFNGRSRGEVLIARVDGMKWADLWRGDSKVSGPDVGLQLWHSKPNLEPTRPGDQGILLALRGVDGANRPRVTVERRGNLSINDGYKEQLELGIRNALSEPLGDLKLLNCQREPSMGLRVELGNQWMKELRIPSRLVAPCQLIVSEGSDTNYRGAYLVQEKTDEIYFGRNFPLQKGERRATIKGNCTTTKEGESASFGQIFQADDLKRAFNGVRLYEPTGETKDEDVIPQLFDFQQRIHAVRAGGRFDTDAYLDSMLEVMDVWQFLRTAAYIMATGSWDTMYRTDANFLLHFAIDDDKEKYKVGVCLPDIDSSLGVSWRDLNKDNLWDNKDIHFQDAPGHIWLIRNLLKNPKCRAYYDDCIHFVVNDVARPELTKQKLDEMWNSITVHSVQRHTPGNRNTTYPFNQEVVRNHVTQGWDAIGWGDRGESGYYAKNPVRFLEDQRANVNRQIDPRNLGKSGANFKAGRFEPTFANW